MSKRSHNAGQAEVASADQTLTASRQKRFFSPIRSDNLLSREARLKEKAQWASCPAADGEQASPLCREWSQSVSHQSKNRETLSATGSLVYSGETTKQSVASANCALELCELGARGIIIQPFVPAAGNANLAPSDCWEEETRKKGEWLELATLEAPRKPARGREWLEEQN